MVVEVCENPFVLNILLFVSQIFKIVFYIIPIGLILFLTIDFFKGIINDEEKVSKQFIFSLKRIINVIGLFLVPTFVSFFMHFVSDLEFFSGDYAACLKNTSNVSYYTEKYEAMVKLEEEKIEALRQQQLEESQYRKELEKLKKIHVVGGAVNKKNGDTSTSVTVGQSFNLTDTQVRNLTAVCIAEQGANKSGVAGEASLMANLYDGEGKDYSSVYDYVYNSEWFSSYSTNNHALNEVTDELFGAVKDVLVNGNRTLPLYINEHDCWFCAEHNGKRCNNGNKGDICYLSNGAQNLSSASDIKNRSNYVKDKTKVYTYYKQNESSASEKYFTFYTFLSDNSDPFGYTEAYYKKIKGST